MKQFNLEEYLKIPSRKVVTRNGRKVKSIAGATEQKAIDDKKIKTLYESIAESKWFADSYKGKSLGEFIEVES